MGFDADIEWLEIIEILNEKITNFISFEFTAHAENERHLEHWEGHTQ